MKKFISSIFYRFEDFRIYATLVIFSILVAATGLLSYIQIKDEVSKLGVQFRHAISKEIAFGANEWIKTRIETVKTFASAMSYTKFINDKNKTFEYIKLVHSDKLFFDHYQILLESGEIAFDGDESPIDKELLDIVRARKWYKNTLEQNTTTVNIFERHEILETQVINVCAPIYSKEEIKAVFCGIIEASNFFQKIRSQIHFFVDNAYIFNENGDIITSIKEVKDKEKFKKVFLEIKDGKDFSDKCFDKSTCIGISKTESQDWYIGVEVDEEAIISSTLKILLRNGIILSILFVCLIFFSNLLHTFIRNKILKKQKEYEYILSHKLKMSETGELISAISHQLKQPLNSSALLLSNITALKRDGEIDDEELLRNLDLCLKSNMMMNETIENFRNFYKFSDDNKEFALIDCVKSLLNILHVEFSRFNISVKLENFDIKMRSNESFIQQILLVLLQNSKDALISKKNGKIIAIDAKINGDMVEIFISDNGDGLSEVKAKTIFDKYKTSSKTHGLGIGLYLSQIIAKNKLGGNLYLHSLKNPTIFKLSLKRDME